MRYLAVALFFAVVAGVLALAEFLGDHFATPLSLGFFAVVIFLLIRSLVKAK